MEFQKSGKTAEQVLREEDPQRYFQDAYEKGIEYPATLTEVETLAKSFLAKRKGGHVFVTVLGPDGEVELRPVQSSGGPLQFKTEFLPKEHKWYGRSLSVDELKELTQGHELRLSLKPIGDGSSSESD